MRRRSSDRPSKGEEPDSYPFPFSDVLDLVFVFARELVLVFGFIRVPVVVPVLAHCLSPRSVSCIASGSTSVGGNQYGRRGDKGTREKDQGRWPCKNR